MSNIKFIRVMPGTKEWDRLIGFAESFDHKPNPARVTMVAQDEKGKWIGYTQLIQTPVLTVAMHPEHGKGRHALEMIRSLKAWSDIQNGESLTGVNPDSEWNDLLPRLGFKDLGLKIFKGD